MKTPPIRTLQMKAQRSANVHARTPEELDTLLQQFSPVHREGLLERLRPHLTFEPKQQ